MNHTHTMKSTIYKTNPVRFSQVGQILGSTLTETGASISKAICKRLLKYASDRAIEVGFDLIISGWSPEVYTMQADEKPLSRYYNVKWTHSKGASVELTGILLNEKGVPIIDHGWECGVE